jgi:uncharacterized membrane protein YeaQ/YmgE (transglycosylase-associated protein family)
MAPRRKSKPETIPDDRIEIVRPGSRQPVNWRPLAATAVVGIAGGWAASLIVGGSGLLRYLVTGVLGALAAEHICERLGWRITVGNKLLDQVLIAAIGAIVVVLLARWIA